MCFLLDKSWMRLFGGAIHVIDRGIDVGSVNVIAQCRAASCGQISTHVHIHRRPLCGTSPVLMTVLAVFCPFVLVSSALPRSIRRVNPLCKIRRRMKNNKNHLSTFPSARTHVHTPDRYCALASNAAFHIATNSRHRSLPPPPPRSPNTFAPLLLPRHFSRARYAPPDRHLRHDHHHHRCTTA